MRRKPVPLVLPAIAPTSLPPHGADSDHVATKYGHGYRPDLDNYAATARNANDSSTRHGVDGNGGGVCSWPSNKAGAKPELLQQLESYVHKQLTLLHHCSTADREMHATLRCDMARHCIRQFEKHFKIYSDVFATLGDTIDAVVVVFDDHRTQITNLQSDLAKSNEHVNQLKRKLVEQDERFRQETKEFQTLGTRLHEVDEDRKVLNALCEELKKQVQKQKQFVDDAQERIDAMSRQHVLHTMRDERHRVKLEQTELGYNELQARLLGLERDKKSYRMKIEMLDVETTRLNKELSSAKAEASQLASIIAAKDEEIKLLRFDQRRRQGGGGGAGIAVDDEAKRKVAPEVEATLRRTMTPRPRWADLKFEDKTIFADIRRVPEGLEDDASAPEGASVQLDATTASLATEVAAAMGQQPGPSASPTTPASPGTRAAGMSTSQEALPELPPVASMDRIAELVRTVNRQYLRLAELEVGHQNVSRRLLVMETLNNALTARDDLPGTHGGMTSPPPAKDAAPSDKKAARLTSPTKGSGLKPVRAPVIATAEKVFVAMGTGIEVPPYLRANTSNHSIGWRPMTLPQVLKHISNACQFISLWLADMDGPKAYEKHQGQLTHIDRGPSFGDGFTEWLIFEYRGRRQDPNASREMPSGTDFPEALSATVDLAEFSLELSYSLIYNASQYATTANSALCRMLLLCLGGDVPRETIQRYFARARFIERVFEDIDTHCTGGVMPLEAGHALRTALPDMGTHHVSALIEVIERERQLSSSPHSRIPFKALMSADTIFMQCLATFFLEAVEFNMLVIPSAVAKAAEGQEDIACSTAITAVQSADPYADSEVVRLYLSECCRAVISKASRINVVQLMPRLRDVFHQRRTPLEFGQLPPEKRLRYSHPVIEIELGLFNTGEVVGAKGGRKVAPPPAAKPVVPRRAV